MTIKNLTHLNLVNTNISHFLLTQIVHAHNLQSLTLHRLVDPRSASQPSLCLPKIVDGRHTLLPHLEAFKFVLVGFLNVDQNIYRVYRSVIIFLHTT